MHFFCSNFIFPHWFIGMRCRNNEKLKTKIKHKQNGIKQETNVRSSNNDSYITKEVELLYRHTVTLTAVYCVAYVIVFIVGLIGNSFVIAVVLRSPRMRTVTNFFIVNLAVADILVIVFCLPATLMGNIFVRKYKANQPFYCISVTPSVFLFFCFDLFFFLLLLLLLLLHSKHSHFDDLVRVLITSVWNMQMTRF